MTERGLAVSERDIQDAALVYALTCETFTVGEFTEFVRMQAQDMEEEHADEVLSVMAERGQLRQIGPGVYGKPVSTAHQGGGA